MAPLSPDPNALALLTDANAKVTCLFLGMGVTHSILPICLWFSMLAVISWHSCVWDRWEAKDKHRQLFCPSLWQAPLKSPAQWLTPIMGRRERRKHLALKAIREVPFLHNQFPLLAEPSQNAFSENKGENPTFSNPEFWPIPAQMRKPIIAWLCENDTNQGTKNRHIRPKMLPSTQHPWKLSNSLSQWWLWHK